jgi:hypothetical protein
MFSLIFHMYSFVPEKQVCRFAMACITKQIVYLSTVVEEQRGVMNIYGVPVGYAGYEGIHR